MQVFLLPMRLNPIKEKLQREILELLRDTEDGYSESYICWLLREDTTKEQVRKILDAMLAQNYITIEGGNFKAVY